MDELDPEIADLFDADTEMIVQETGLTEAERLPEQGVQTGAAVEKRPRGRPFPKGVSGNPGGKPKVREPEDPEIDSQGGAITAARMQKVMSQSPEADVGPERGLRLWLDKTPGDYVKRMREIAAEEQGYDELKAQVDRLQTELAEARQRNEGSTIDEGSTRSETLLEEWFVKYENAS